MDKEQKITKYLKSLYAPVAIVLTGSRVSGNFSPTSDWDLCVFTHKELKFEHGHFEEEKLDIMTIPYPVPADFILNTNYHPEQHIKILYDTSGGWVHELVQRTHLVYQKGPAPLPDQEYARLQKMMQAYIDKVDGRKEIRGLAFYYLGIFYQIALRLWFQVKNEWPLPPYEALPHIQEADPAFYELLSVLQDIRETQAQINTARKIHQNLLNRAG